METIKLYGFQLDFIRDLLHDHLGSKSSDQDTRMLAQDTLEFIEGQIPIEEGRCE